jgi:GNAT superfamily N-acetyltransferase
VDALAFADLAAWPDLADTVVDRLWRGWGRATGESRDVLAAKVAGGLAVPRLPFCLVARDDDGFAGTAAVVGDAAGTTAWIAALWIEEDRRGRGYGSRLLDGAAAHACALGARHVRLIAEPELADFYETRGWRLVEGGAGALGAMLFAREGSDLDG